MGRPPCCEKVGIKKGPWTPEEDIILVSYIQEHGPGNWRSVPTNTGLSRCSKSCRLRWTNYLRPGIKRGNFTPHEEGMIIHLQALLGNKWAAIASYLPQRTDNDIKNYWNTHLKKKLKKFQAASTMDAGPHHHLVASNSNSNSSSTTTNLASSKSFNNDNRTRMDEINNNNNNGSSTTTTTYASSTENISRLLEGWMRTSPKPPLLKGGTTTTQEEHDDLQGREDHNKTTKDHEDQQDHNIHEEFDSILSFDNLNSPQKYSEDDGAHKNVVMINRQKSHDDQSNGAPPLSFLEKWLLDENVGQVEMMELSPMF